MLSVLLAVFLIALLTFLIKKFSKNDVSLFPPVKDVPGLKKSDPILGNLPDIFKAGDLPRFLKQLHAEFGPIASYWHQDVFTVSLGDPKYFRITEKMFDRHSAMFEFALPLISWKSMQFLNGEFGRNRFKFMAQPFAFSGCENVLEKINAIVKEDISKLDITENIPLHEKLMEIAINIITKTHFGCHFQEEKNSKTLLEGYRKVFTDFDDALLGVWSFGQGDAREEEFHKNVQDFKNEIKRIVEAHIRVRDAGDYDPAPFLDALIDNIDDEDEIVHQAITFMIGGFHTSGTMMTWFFYNLGLHPDIQNKVQEEIQRTMKSKNLESMEALETLIFTKQVVTEIVGYLEFGSFSWRRMGREMKLNGYVIKKGTHILNARSLELDYIKSSPNSCLFDPENFNETNISSYSRHKLSDVKSDSNRSR